MLEQHLTDLVEGDDAFVWPISDFAPVAQEIERAFDSLGLLRWRVDLAA